MDDIRLENPDAEFDEGEDPPTIDDDQDVDYLPEEDASDIEQEEIIEESEESDESDEEIEGDVFDDPDDKDSFFYGTDGTKWSKDEPPTAVQIRQYNTLRFRSGPKQQLSDPREVFKKLFTPNISLIIISETNRYGGEAVQSWNQAHPDSKRKHWVDLSSTELDAFVGILLAMGASHNNMQKASDLWRSDALPIFRSAMSYHRFRVLTRYIRFDNGRTRELRKRVDKAAAIRDIWKLLNENLKDNYDPHENVTIEEQLFPYRGKTKFTQYIPSKPAKYGIKVWWACDSRTRYPLQGKLYCGRSEKGEREVGQNENVMMQLANRYQKSGRTIIADDSFVTLDGAKRLAAIGLELVGPIGSKKRCIPPEMKESSSRPVLSSVFGFHGNSVSICSYVPRKNKAVNLLSTIEFFFGVDETFGRQFYRYIELHSFLLRELTPREPNENREETDKVELRKSTVKPAKTG
ncbi:piggyBac transposable element-derived protein 4-like [Drosophila ficusphila]|uniref:piggyBac transposable element-derived protein 4-like n=1 Tax=Drosophila ficusphila TaxID=30025 RepID=UPI001C8994A5|nr:piggyBac transposable element-derived protein 4-like [Drosophila ficusphila]